MSAPTTRTDGDTTVALGTPRGIDRAARRALARKLGRLREQAVELVDADGPRRLGAGAAARGAPPRGLGREPRFYRRAVLGGHIGAAESYAAGAWDAEDLVGLLRVFVREAATAFALDRGPARLSGAIQRGAHRLRRHTRRGARRQIAAHYDLGDELFALFLDKSMTYSCGIFETPDSSLEAAQAAKHERVCRRLELRAGDRLLEIGGGWGAFALHAAAAYGARVTTVTISNAQRRAIDRRVREHGLDDHITVVEADYRDVSGTYDKIASIEMVEALGHAALPGFFRAVSERLADDGLALIQGITLPDQQYERYRRSVDFIQSHIFPGSQILSVAAIAEAVRRGSDLRIEALEDIGAHYAPTLRTWRQRFDAEAESIAALGYPEPFRRLFRFYFAYCEAGFAERYLGDVQLLLRKPGRRRPMGLPPLPRPDRAEGARPWAP